MKIRFYKTNEIIGLNYVKIPLRSNAILNIINFENYCFLWSILVRLHPCKNDHPMRVSKCKKYFDELKSKSLDFSYGFRCSDVHIIEKLINLSINTFE